MLDQTVASFDAQSGVHAALARHGLSARELLLGTITLTSAANMAFYRKHETQILQHQLKYGMAAFHAHGGK